MSLERRLLLVECLFTILILANIWTTIPIQRYRNTSGYDTDSNCLHCFVVLDKYGSIALGVSCFVDFVCHWFGAFGSYSSIMLKNLYLLWCGNCTYFFRSNLTSDLELLLLMTCLWLADYGWLQVDSAFHPSEVDKMSNSSFWELSGKK